MPLRHNQKSIAMKALKYFLDCDTQLVHIVAEQYHHLVDVINSGESSDREVNLAKDKIVQNCKVLIKLDASMQTLDLFD